MAPKRDKGEERDLAAERIAQLGELAAEAARAGDEGLSSRYLQLAVRIGMRHQLTLPTELRRHRCRTCGSYLVPGRNARVRVRKGKRVATCLLCERVDRVTLGGAREPAAARTRGTPRGRR